MAKVKECPESEIIGDYSYRYYKCFPLKKGHKHTIECITPEMEDALSEEAYEDAK